MAPAETVYCSVSNKGVLRWESSFDLSGQSFRCPFGHNFSDGLVLLRDLRGRTGHRTLAAEPGSGGPWQSGTRLAPNLRCWCQRWIPDSWTEQYGTGKQTGWNAGNPQPRPGHQGWSLSRKVYSVPALHSQIPEEGTEDLGWRRCESCITKSSSLFGAACILDISETGHGTEFSRQNDLYFIGKF